MVRLLLFQSTRPIRGATAPPAFTNRSMSNFNPRAPYGARLNAISSALSFGNFNPRAPYGARLCLLVVGHRWLQISIHAPHTGRDVAAVPVREPVFRFQSTRPIRGATCDGAMLPRPSTISIHAPHTGRDGSLGFLCGDVRLISIHAPHTGRDCFIHAASFAIRYFNPRAPYGARHRTTEGMAYTPHISIHAPHTGRDVRTKGVQYSQAISIHAPHTGRDVIAPQILGAL